jgi:predicted  nucleic acid-binding Zn ribbon protein
MKIFEQLHSTFKDYEGNQYKGCMKPVALVKAEEKPQKTDMTDYSNIFTLDGQCLRGMKQFNCPHCGKTWALDADFLKERKEKEI